MSVVRQPGEFGGEQENYGEFFQRESMGAERIEAGAETGSPSGETPGSVADVEKILRDLHVYISGARATSMSSALRIDRDYVLGLIQNARTLLPVALRSARWLIKEREEYLARAQRDADAVIEQASAEAARRVEETEIVLQSKRRAQEIEDAAYDRARTQIHEADDYCDRRFERCELIMRKALEDLIECRRLLQGETERVLEADPPDEAEAGSEIRGGFFDQDQI